MMSIIISYSTTDGSISVSSVLSIVSRSDSLRKHKDSGVCKEAQTSMSDSDEESVASAKSSYAHGRDIFREYDPDGSVEKG